MGEDWPRNSDTPHEFGADKIRLLNLKTAELCAIETSSCPPYLAASHAWQDAVFTCSPRPDGSGLITESFGWQALRTTATELHPDVEYCWIDLLCIDQSDERDKHLQIPLMGRIFGQARAVVVLMNCDLSKLSQEAIDVASQLLAPAVAMSEEETYQEHGAYWQDGQGRGIINRAMSALALLTQTGWSTRIWTLQEYVLGRQVIWTGIDLRPIMIADAIIAALPIVCDQLNIEECLSGEFEKLYSHFLGMVNARLHRNDPTRIMELLGNRSATMPADEVYGVMAVSGVQIQSRIGETRENAWQRWWEEAIKQGHLRWLHTPIPKSSRISTSHESSDHPPHNCLVPDFSQRHTLSSSSKLDTVRPLGPVAVEDGMVITTARYVGKCRITCRLGELHAKPANRIHRDITLILFSRGRWHLALRVSQAFGGGRYSLSQIRLLARVMTRNYGRALAIVAKECQSSFTLLPLSQEESRVWSDFMNLQSGLMIGINESIAYLARIDSNWGSFEVVLGLAKESHKSNLSAFSFDAVTLDDRYIFMIVHTTVPLSEQSEKGSSNSPMHKVGLTLAVGLEADQQRLHKSLPLQVVRLGGYRCQGCQTSPMPSRSERSRLPSVSAPLRIDKKQALLRERLERRLLLCVLRFQDLEKGRNGIGGPLVRTRKYRLVLQRLRKRILALQPLVLDCS